MKQPIRVRLSGSETLPTKELRCDMCGKAIVLNYQAQTPIYYVYPDDDDRVVCIDCKI